MSEALNIIKDPTLTYNQELIALAKLGENSDDTLVYSDEYYKAFNSTGYTHFYELKPVNGEPRYAKIICQVDYGKIYDAYVCTPDDADYDNPLYERG